MDGYSIKDTRQKRKESMSRRKGLKKQENDAQKENIIKDNLLDMFNQFREEVRSEIEDLKEVVADLK